MATKKIERAAGNGKRGLRAAGCARFPALTARLLGGISVVWALVASAAADNEAAARPQSAQSGSDVDRVVTEARVSEARQRGVPVLTVTGRRVEPMIERIERIQARDVREIFAEEPSVSIGGGTRNGQRLYLRGIEGSNINVTVDGARQGQNLYNHRGGLGNVDPDVLQRVEVRAGPPAADDGHAALGGSIRFVTRDAQDLLEPGRGFGARVSGGATTADEGRRISGLVYGEPVAGLGLLGSYSRSEYEDLRIGDGARIPFSGGEDRATLLKATWLGRQGHALRLGLEHHEASGLNFMQRGDYPWQLQPEDFRARPPQDQSLERTTYTVEYRFDPDSDLIDLVVSLYETENDFDAPASNGENFTSRGRGGKLQNGVRFALGSWNAETVIGLDRIRDRGEARRNNREPRSNEYRNDGIYLQNRLQHPRGQVSFGVRRDDFKVEYRGSGAGDDAWLVNAGGLVELGADVAVFAGYGEAARGAPAIPIHFAGNVVENVRFNGEIGGNLRPELSRQSEFGARWSPQIELLADGSFEVELLRFLTRIEDPIVYLQPGSGGLGGRPVTEFVNASDTARFEGYEARLRLALGAWQASLGFTRSEVDSLPAAPQYLARIGAPSGDRMVMNVGYAFRAGVSAGYTLTHVRDLDDVPADQIVFIEKPGYTVHDLFLSYAPQWLTGLNLDLALRNAFDKRYSSHATLTQNGFATEEPGRDLRLTVRYTF